MRILHSIEGESRFQKEEKEVEEVAQEEVYFVVFVVVRIEEVQIDAFFRRVAGAVVGEEAASGGEVCQGPEVARVQEEPQREGHQGGGEEVSEGQDGHFTYKVSSCKIVHCICLNSPTANRTGEKRVTKS